MDADTTTGPPADPDGAVKLGLAARKAGRPAEALACFERALACAPAHLAARLEAATILRETGRLDEAETAYRAALALAPDHARALVGLGRIARGRGDRAAALARFEAAANAAPDHPGPRSEAADVLRELDRLDEAEARYREALGLDPRNLRSLLGLGRIARRRGDPEAALARFEAAASAAPDDPKPRSEAAGLLRELGRLDEAETAYRSLLGFDPRNLRALAALARIERQRGDRAAARSRFEEALALDPEASGLRLELAAECRDLGDFDAARRAAEAVLARAPDDFNAWVNLAQTERRAGKREAALAAFGRALKANPGYAQGLAEMAVEERALGRPFEAERLLARALAADPRDVAALSQMGDQARLSDDLPAALGWFERAMAAAPSHLGARLKAGQTLADLGRFGDALALLRARDAAFAPAFEALEKEAHILRKTGDWDAARGLLEQASAAAPRSFPVWSQRAQLEWQSGDHAALAAMLRDPPVRTVADRALARHLQGQLAEAGWRFDEAAGHYEHAARLNPNDGMARLSLARVRLLTFDLAGCRMHLAERARLERSKALLQGRSSNPSQTHLGQLLDEFALDRAALAPIAAAQAFPPAERVAPLLAAVRNAPDHTPSAIALMIALRQAGAFAAGTRRETGASPIPRTMAQYWDTPDLPGDLVRLRATWRDRNPDFAFRLFDDASAGAFLKENYAADVFQAYSRAREPAKKADLFRLACLFAEGGYYADVDDRCGAPIAEIVPPHAGLALYQEEYGTVGNNFIAAVPRHPVIGLALDLAVEAIARDDRDVLWLSTGPGLLTRAFARTLAGSRLHWKRWLESIVVLERRELARAVRVHCACSYKQTDRHWSRTAFGRAAKRGDQGEARRPMSRPPAMAVEAAPA